MGTVDLKLPHLTAERSKAKVTRSTDRCLSVRGVWAHSSRMEDPTQFKFSV